MEGGIWIVLAIPTIIAFVFGVWVFYSMVVDVSERDMELDRLNNCVEGCKQIPPDQR